MLHLAPVVNDVGHNRSLLESAVRAAGEQGAHRAITTELWVSGYSFIDQIGAGWILPQPDDWMRRFCRLAGELELTVFLSHPERDPETDRLYNTVFVIDRQGEIRGKHRKINTSHGAESWSSPGWQADPVDTDGAKVGILVCGDGYNNGIAQSLKDKGARALVSSHAWGPGNCGPSGEREQRTLDTGLPIMVCNRSGIEDDGLDFRRAESMVAQHGRRLLTGTCGRSAILSFDWDMETMTLLSPGFHRTYV